MEQKSKFKYYTHNGVEVKVGFNEIKTPDFILLGKATEQELNTLTKYGVLEAVEVKEVTKGSDFDIDKNNNKKEKTQEGKIKEDKNLDKRIELSNFIRKIFSGKDHDKSYSLIIKTIAIKKNMDPKKVHNIVMRTIEINKLAAFQILFMEAAYLLDMKYEDHIKESAQIWSWSNSLNKICCLNKNSIISYKNFAAFRSREDILLALNALKPIVEAVFKVNVNKL